jgi:hypothetical protein
MGWDAISAIGSIVAATVLLVATVAALIQLKHLRLANQIGGAVTIKWWLVSSISAFSIASSSQW